MTEMRIKIVGTSDSVLTLRKYLEVLGYAIVESFSDYTIYLDKDENAFITTIDGIDSELERSIILRLEELGIPEFLLQRKGGIRSDREIRITFNSSISSIIERGVARGIDLAINSLIPKKEEKPKVKVRWFKRIFK